MSEPIKKIGQKPESYSPKDKPAILNVAEEIFNRNTIPKRLVLENVPKIGWGSINGRAPTDYSLPGCLGNIIAFIEANEGGADSDNKKSRILSDVAPVGFGQVPTVTPDNASLDRANQDLMNVTGISYASLWLDGDGFNTMINELARVNHFHDMIERSMRYYGRDYFYIEDDENLTYYEEIKKAVIVSINKGYPVLAESICGIPEFSIITGYDDYGDKLIGWAYCSECASEFLENGMFIKGYDNNNPKKAQWGWSKLLIIDGKTEKTLSDKDIIGYAAEVMERRESQNTSYRVYRAGISALYEFKKALSERTEELFKPVNGHFIHLFILNLAEPRAYIHGFIMRLGEKYIDNSEITAIIADIRAVSDKTHKTCWDMWKVKDDGNLSVEEKRDQLSELTQICIDGDVKLLESLNKLKGLL